MIIRHDFKQPKSSLSLFFACVSVGDFFNSPGVPHFGPGFAAGRHGLEDRALYVGMRSLGMKMSRRSRSFLFGSFSFVDGGG